MSHPSNQPNLARRRALRVIGQGVVGAVVFARAADAFAGKCDDGISDAEKKMRKTLQYVDESKQKGKNCSTCAQYIAPEKGKACAGCKLPIGPVAPKGYCLSYAPTK